MTEYTAASGFDRLASEPSFDRRNVEQGRPQQRSAARRTSCLSALLALVALAGCSSLAPVTDSLPPGVFAEAPLPAAKPQAPPTETAPSDERTEPMLVRGSDQVIRLPAAPAPFEISGEAVTLHFEQAPVADVVRAVLGDIMNVDYTLHEPIEGTITLHTHRPVPRDQIPALLDTVLAPHGIAISRDARGFFHVGMAEGLRVSAPGISRAGARGAGFGTVIVPLRHIGAAEMATILQPFATPGALLRVDTVRNLLMLMGSRTQIEGWLDIVGTFDVDLLAGMSVGMFPIQHVSVGEIETALNTILGKTGQAAPDSSTAQPENAAAATNPSLPLGPLTGLLRIVPIERLNSILVVTPRAAYLDKVREWIERFDQPAETEHGQQLFVYPVQNGSAAHLAALLNGLFGDEGAQISQPSRDAGVAPGLGLGVVSSAAQASAGGLAAGATGGGATIKLPATGSTSPGQAAQVTQLNLGAQVRVVADEYNNALLIHAPRREYRSIEAALRRLDVSPTQVLIEASIVEITLNDELKYGLQWYFNNSIGGGRTGSGLLNGRKSGDIAPEQPGFSYTITNSAGMVRAVLNALATKSLVNVISTPSIMVQDNHTATIHVGDQQPVRSSETITDGGRTTTSIQYKDTGVMLSVTPSANAGGMIALDVHQSVTDVGQVDVATSQRSFLQRQLSSRVAVRSGETVVLGGLIRDNQTRGRQGVPVLHDLPLVGNLFGATTVNTDRTELLVMITPRVLQHEADHRAVLDEMRGRMHGLRELLERGAEAGKRDSQPLESTD